jgi:peptide chain release factor 1
MDPVLRSRLEDVVVAFEEVEAELLDPAILTDGARYAEVAQRHAELRQVVELFRAHESAVADAVEAAELAGVEEEVGLATELRTMAAEREGAAEVFEARLRSALVPTDPEDAKDALVEIRAAAGGDEASIWAGDLLRMFERYAERHGYRTEVLEASPSEAGGYDKVTLGVKGRGVFGRMKYEAGVHRVQRVPRTESQGRIHTSTATVAVLPEADEVEVEVDPADVRVDVFRSSGPGGQSVNTTDSAVRLTHLPTGLVVSCQDEKSQLQNKEKAFRILRARLYARMLEERHAGLAADRRSQVGTGSRSEKIRTDNYKEGRVTDHRVGLTLKQLPAVLDGDLDPFVDRLVADDQAARLADGT